MAEDTPASTEAEGGFIEDTEQAPGMQPIALEPGSVRVTVTAEPPMPTLNECEQFFIHASNMYRWAQDGRRVMQRAVAAEAEIVQQEQRGQRLRAENDALDARTAARMAEAQQADEAHARHLQEMEQARNARGQAIEQEITREQTRAKQTTDAAKKALKEEIDALEAALTALKDRRTAELAEYETMVSERQETVKTLTAEIDSLHKRFQRV